MINNKDKIFIICLKLIILVFECANNKAKCTADETEIIPDVPYTGDKVVSKYAFKSKFSYNLKRTVHS